METEKNLTELYIIISFVIGMAVMWFVNFISKDEY